MGICSHNSIYFCCGWIFWIQTIHQFTWPNSQKGVWCNNVDRGYKTYFFKMIEQIKKMATSAFNEIVEIRRYLHQHPELSFQEYKTSAYFSLLIILPVLAKHRGWTHSSITAIVLPNSIMLVPMYLSGDSLLEGLPYYCAALF